MTTQHYIQSILLHLTDLEFEINNKYESDGVLIINKEHAGIKHLILGIAPPILVIEQFLFEVKGTNPDVFQQLLIKNRDIVHGAFALNSEGNKVIFRDTLQLENLDRNELEASLNALSILLGEYADQIIEFSKN